MMCSPSRGVHVAAISTPGTKPMAILRIAVETRIDRRNLFAQLRRVTQNGGRAPLADRNAARVEHWCARQAGGSPFIWRCAQRDQHGGDRRFGGARRAVIDFDRNSVTEVYQNRRDLPSRPPLDRYLRVLVPQYTAEPPRA